MFYEYTPFRDKVLIHTLYSDTLYVIDPERLQCEKKIALQYSGGQLGISPIPISDETWLNESELFMKETDRGGYLSHIFADRDGDYVFVVAIPRRTEEEVRNKISGEVRLLVLDSMLNQVDEELFDKASVSTGFIIPVRNGFLFSLDRPENPNFDERKARFALYRYQ